MMPQFRRFAWALVLVAGTGTAVAQTTVITREPGETRAIVAQEPLVLSPEQRTVIYRTIRQERVVPVQPPTVQYRIGMRVPEATTLYEVPQTLVTEVPIVRPYKYMMVNNRVWLVDPATSEIVAEVGD
ncbi:MAG TPA: DUF1236 domain-containing protein [Pseudolabrys sp.]|nr:DUF1236 domain-containing protein [Pseudolabrys sp.]